MRHDVIYFYNILIKLCRTVTGSVNFNMMDSHYLQEDFRDLGGLSKVVVEGTILLFLKVTTS